MTIARGAAWVALGALPFWAFEQRWIAGVSAVGFGPLLVVLSAYTWLAVWACAHVVRLCGARWSVGLVALGPIVWGGVEFFRGRVAFDGYPWYLAGMPTIESAWLSGAGAVVGVYGVGVLVAGVSASVAGLVLAQKSRRAVAIGLGAWVVLWAGLAWFGGGELDRAMGESGALARFGVVQTNVPQSVRGTWSPMDRLLDAAHFLDLSQRAQADGAQVLVWPETMFPGEVLEAEAASAEVAAGLVWPLLTSVDSAVRTLGAKPWLLELGLLEDPESGNAMVWTGAARDVVLSGQRAIGVPMLMGAEGFDGYRVESDGIGPRRAWSGRFNSVFVVDGGGVVGARYDKMHLTPFGETMPYISRWAWLESVLLRVGVGARGMRFDLDAGDRVVRHELELSGARWTVATPICFEATMPHVVRRLVVDRGERASGVIVQMTNDGWFGSARGGREQHLDAVRWRAVELGTPIVRAANTGVSAFVDARGRVVERLGAKTDGVLVAEVVAAAGPVPMAGRMGDRLGWVTLGVTVACLLLAAGRGLRAGMGQKGAAA